MVLFCATAGETTSEEALSTPPMIIKRAHLRDIRVASPLTITLGTSVGTDGKYTARLVRCAFSTLHPQALVVIGNRREICMQQVNQTPEKRALESTSDKAGMSNCVTDMAGLSGGNITSPKSSGNSPLLACQLALSVMR